MLTTKVLGLLKTNEKKKKVRHWGPDLLGLLWEDYSNVV